MKGLWARAAFVTDGHLAVFTVAWVMVGGLMLQLVVLPYVFTDIYWGHGLIAGMDWTYFHNVAVEQAERIHVVGWTAWRLRPGGQFPAGLASALYALVRPEPWVVLPVNAILFATAVVATRRLLVATFASRSAALTGVMPFFAFPSFVPIWGQLHKDVFTGAGFALVLAALVQARRKDGETGIGALVITGVVGMATLWLARPYTIYLVGFGLMAYVVPTISLRSTNRPRLAVVALAVLMSALLLMRVPTSSGDIEFRRDVPSDVIPQFASEPALRGNRWWPRTRLLEASIPAQRVSFNYLACAPRPTAASDWIDRLLFSACLYREGFKSNGATSGSNHDYDVRMRIPGDFIAYAPRALQVAILEPGMSAWGSEESPIGRLATMFVPFEMICAYGAFGAALVFASRQLARLDVLAILGFCVTYVLFFVYTAPNLGLIYRARAFAFVIVVGVALAATLSQLEAVRQGHEPEAG